MTTESRIPEKSRTNSLLARLGARLIGIARQKDTPHRIGLGMALGIFVGILPIMGIQMTVVAIIVLPLRGNLKAAVAGVWISNPITFIPMYWGYYKFGLLFFPSRQVSWERFTEIVASAAEWDWSNITGSTAKILALGADILIPMWTGSIILAIVFSIPTYFVTKRLVVSYRARKAEKKERKQRS